MNKKVVYVRTDIYNNKLIAGGSVTHTIGILNGFLDHSYDIICVTTCLLEHIRQLPLFRIIRFPSTMLLMKMCGWKITCLLSNFIFSPALLYTVLRHKPLFIYQRYSPLNSIGVLISKITNTPLVLEFNGSEVWVEQHWSKKSWFRLKWLFRITEWINYRYAHTIIVVSDVLKEDLKKKKRVRNVLVIPNGVNTTFFDPALCIQERMHIRNLLNINQKFVFGFIGTFNQWHGIDIIETIITALVKRTIAIHFLLIGDGTQRISLEESLKEKNITQQYVTFTGMQPRPQARGYLSACDAFLTPTQPNPDGSRFFGSPTKIFEYMSLAKPIIASDLEQLAHVLSPALTINTLTTSIKNHCGILINPCSYDDFVEAAYQVSIMPEQQRQLLGNNARNKAVQNFQWSNHITTLLNHMENACC